MSTTSNFNTEPQVVDIKNDETTSTTTTSSKNSRINSSRQRSRDDAKQAAHALKSKFKTLSKRSKKVKDKGLRKVESMRNMKQQHKQANKAENVETRARSNTSGSPNGSRISHDNPPRASNNPPAFDQTYNQTQEHPQSDSMHNNNSYNQPSDTTSENFREGTSDQAISHAKRAAEHAAHQAELARIEAQESRKLIEEIEILSKEAEHHKQVAEQAAYRAKIAQQEVEESKRLMAQSQIDAARAQSETEARDYMLQNQQELGRLKKLTIDIAFARETAEKAAQDAGLALKHAQEALSQAQNQSQTRRSASMDPSTTTSSSIPSFTSHPSTTTTSSSIPSFTSHPISPTAPSSQRTITPKANESTSTSTAAVASPPPVMPSIELMTIKTAVQDELKETVHDQHEVRENKKTVEEELMIKHNQLEHQKQEEAKFQPNEETKEIKSQVESELIKNVQIQSETRENKKTVGEELMIRQHEQERQQKKDAKFQPASEQHNLKTKAESELVKTVQTQSETRENKKTVEEELMIRQQEQERQQKKDAKFQPASEQHDLKTKAESELVKTVQTQSETRENKKTVGEELMIRQQEQERQQKKDAKFEPASEQHDLKSKAESELVKTVQSQSETRENKKAVGEELVIRQQEQEREESANKSKERKEMAKIYVMKTKVHSELVDSVPKTSEDEVAKPKSQIANRFVESVIAYRAQEQQTKQKDAVSTHHFSELDARLQAKSPKQNQ